MINTKSNLQQKFYQPTKQHQEKEKNQRNHLEFVGKSKNCCVCLVDIVGSTKLLAKIPDSKSNIFYSTFLNDMANVVETNNGHIVKSIGDALLFYFDDSIVDYLSVALRCGLEMTEKRDKINNILNDNDLPSISYRVSSDCGKVMVGYSSVSVVDDIFGTVVNICSKINRLANLNGMVIGNDFYLMAKLLDKFQFSEIKSELDIGLKNKYPVFDVRKN